MAVLTPSNVLSEGRFRFWRIERDVFAPERGYPEGLEENGIPLRDMVWLDQEF
jgi:hypothetical protein